MVIVNLQPRVFGIQAQVSYLGFFLSIHELYLYICGERLVGEDGHMSDLSLFPTSTSQLHALICDAEKMCNVRLKEDLESYLVFLLLRYLESPKTCENPIAIEWLESLKSSGTKRHNALKEVGDKCLLFSGLFPGIAKQRRVSVGYYVNIGKAAFLQLSEEDFMLKKLFLDIYEGFVPLMDVLQTTREVDNALFSLDPMQAEELFRETGSLHAKAILQEYTKGGMILSIPPSNTQH